MISSNIVNDFNQILDSKYISYKMLAKRSGISENEITKTLESIIANDIKIGTLMDFFRKTGFTLVFSLDGETTEDHSLGYILKDLMKRKRISKKKLADILNEEYRDVSLGIKNIYDNKGEISLLIKYIDAAGIDFRYWFS